MVRNNLTTARSSLMKGIEVIETKISHDSTFEIDVGLWKTPEERNV